MIADDVELPRSVTADDLTKEQELVADLTRRLSTQALVCKCDLGQTGVEQGIIDARRMDADSHQKDVPTLIVPPMLAFTAARIVEYQRKLGFALNLIVLPAALMPNSRGWAVSFGGHHTAWSEAF